MTIRKDIYVLATNITVRWSYMIIKEIFYLTLNITLSQHTDKYN